MLIDPSGQFDPRGESESRLTTMSIVTPKKMDILMREFINLRDNVKKENLVAIKSRKQLFRSKMHKLPHQKKKKNSFSST